MVTIYRRGQAIARCARAEVLAGLRSGRFELSDHYESPETDGWISLTHFESRAYERQPRMVFRYTPGDTVDTDQGLVPLEGQQRSEALRRLERKPQRAPTPHPCDDPGTHPLIGLAGLIAAPFVFLRNALDLVLQLAGSLISQAALYLIPILLIILVAIACFFFPPIGGILLALGLYLRKRNRD
jgi:hypothetical protein